MFSREKKIFAGVLVSTLIIVTVIIILRETSPHNKNQTKVAPLPRSATLSSSINLSAEDFSSVARKWYKLKNQLVKNVAPNEAGGPQLSDGKIVFSGTPWDHSLELEEKNYLTLKPVEFDKTFSFHAEFTFTQTSYLQRVFEFQTPSGVVFTLGEHSEKKTIAFSVITPDNGKVDLVTPELLGPKISYFGERVPENLVGAAFSVWGCYDPQSGRAILYGTCLQAENTYGQTTIFGFTPYEKSYFAVSQTKNLFVTEKLLSENHVGHSQINDAVYSATNMKLVLLRLPILPGSPSPQRLTLYVQDGAVNSEPKPLYRYFKRASETLQMIPWDNPKFPAYEKWFHCFASGNNGNINDKSGYNTTCNYARLHPVIVDLQKPLIISAAFCIHQVNGWYQRILEMRSTRDQSLLLSLGQYQNSANTLEFEISTPKGTYFARISDFPNVKSFDQNRRDWGNGGIESSAHMSTFATITVAGMKLQVNGKTSTTSLPDEFYDQTLVFDLCTLCGSTLSYDGGPSFTNASVQHLEIVNDIAYD